MGFTTDPGQLKEILLNREDYVVGGVDVIIAGKPGCGKTTGLVKFAMGNQKKYKDVIIWRGSPDCQWTLFRNLKKPPEMVLWLKKGLIAKFFSRDKEKPISPKRYFSEIRTWKNAGDLIENIDKNKINVVQTTPFNEINPKQHIEFCRDWMKIFNTLNKRMWKNSVSVFFDEMEDLVPEAKGKDFWDMELAFSSIIRSLRKNYISSYFAGHSMEEIHWRIRKKVRWKIYMKGAKPEANTKLTINTNRLPVGKAWVEGGQIEPFRFKPIGKEHNIRALITDKRFETDF